MTQTSLASDGREPGSKIEGEKFRLGTQGWSYKDWVATFYPPNTPPRDYLDFYSRIFDVVEIDTTFYGPPKPDTVRAWDAATPAGFEFAAKMPRIITHDRKLHDAGHDLLEFLEAMEPLGAKLGPILIQLPPSFDYGERAALEEFLPLLPDEFRYAVEFRHPSWLRHETRSLLEERRLAWTVIDLHYMPQDTTVTTDFTYVRWLGNREDIKRLDRIQIDRSEDIDAWAEQLERIARRVQRIYGFMNNHYAGHSPGSVADLKGRLAPSLGRSPLRLACGSARPAEHGSGMIRALIGYVRGNPWGMALLCLIVGTVGAMASLTYAWPYWFDRLWFIVWFVLAVALSAVGARRWAHVRLEEIKASEAAEAGTRAASPNLEEEPAVAPQSESGKEQDLAL